MLVLLILLFSIILNVHSFFMVNITNLNIFWSNNSHNFFTFLPQLFVTYSFLKFCIKCFYLINNVSNLYDATLDLDVTNIGIYNSTESPINCDHYHPTPNIFYQSTVFLRTPVSSLIYFNFHRVDLKRNWYFLNSFNWQNLLLKLVKLMLLLTPSYILFTLLFFILFHEFHFKNKFSLRGSQNNSLILFLKTESP